MTDKTVAAILLTCLGVLSAWQLAAYISSRQSSPLRISAANFAGFTPSMPGWGAESFPVGSDPLEPNVLVYRLTPSGSVSNSPVTMRLVHGYNTRDCMRIKHYEVELLQDVREGPGDGVQEKLGTVSRGRMEVWRVTSSDGSSSVWATRMVRSADFSAAGMSVTDMAFPKVGIPDAPEWAPRGLRLGSFRHPIRNFRSLLRSKWNSSRSDLLTFLRLRRPAWASDEVLTIVVASAPSVPDIQDEARVVGVVSGVADGFMRELQRWHRASVPGSPGVRAARE